MLTLIWKDSVPCLSVSIQCYYIHWYTVDGYWCVCPTHLQPWAKCTCWNQFPGCCEGETRPWPVPAGIKLHCSSGCDLTETEKTEREFSLEEATALKNVRKVHFCYSDLICFFLSFSNESHLLQTQNAKSNMTKSVILWEDCRCENIYASLDSLMASICHLKNNKCEAFACAGYPGLM